MLTESIHDQIVQIKEKMRKKERLQKRLLAVRKTLTDEKVRLSELHSRMIKEEADVKKFEGLSLEGLFVQIIGDKEARLEKEREEFLRAKLKYDQCRYAVESMEQDVEQRKAQIDGFKNVREEYEQCLVLREEAMRNHPELLKVSESLIALDAQLKELDEARAAGEQVLIELDKVLDCLQSAKNWGVFDLVGGGLIATAVKHSKMDKARSAVHQVQQLLHAFHRELQDVQSENTVDLQVDLSGFLHFADFFFDGLIADWFVQSKIGKAFTNTQSFKTKVEKVMETINMQYHQVQEKHNTVNQKRRKLLESA